MPRSIPCFFALLLSVPLVLLAPVRAWSQAAQSAAGVIDTTRTERDSKLGILVEVPQSYKGRVVFVAGTSLRLGAERRSGELNLGTNLLGALGAKAIGTIGAKGVEDYFTKNISAGTAIPFDRGHRMTADVGLGLGELKVPGGRLWPVLNMSQRDSSDLAVPRPVVRGKPDKKSWTSPVVAVAFVWGDYEKNVKDGKLTPIFTLGAQLPYYLAADPFEAMVSVFTSKRGEFVRSGRVSWTLGVSIPLYTPK